MIRVALVTALLAGLPATTVQAEPLNHSSLYTSVPRLSHAPIKRLLSSATLEQFDKLFNQASDQYYRGEVVAEVATRRELLSLLHKHYDDDYWLIQTERQYLASSERAAALKGEAAAQIMGARAAYALGREHQDRDEWTAAISEFRTAEEAFVAALGAADISVFDAKYNKALTLYKTGKMSDAYRHYEDAVSLARALHGADHPSVAMALCGMALIKVDSDEYRLAEPMVSRCLAIYSAHGLQPTSEYADAQLLAAMILNETDRPEQAGVAATEAFSIYNLLGTDASVDMALLCQYELGRSLLARRKPDSVIALFQPIILDNDGKLKSSAIAPIIGYYALALHEVGREEDALRYKRLAIERGRK
jgi:tetratricopeptide (TPR) repeat protein